MSSKKGLSYVVLILFFAFTLFSCGGKQVEPPKTEPSLIPLYGNYLKVVTIRVKLQSVPEFEKFVTEYIIPASKGILEKYGEC